MHIIMERMWLYIILAGHGDPICLLFVETIRLIKCFGNHLMYCICNDLMYM